MAVLAPSAPPAMAADAKTNPDTGKERYLVDELNEVRDLRSEEDDEKDEDDPLQDK
jgi:hypothetical protein